MEFPVSKIKKTEFLLRDFACFLASGFNGLLWPPVCINCAEDIADAGWYLCNNCWQSLRSCLAGDYCGHCGASASRYAIVDGRCAGCRDKSPEFDGIARVGLYTSVLRRLILSFKNGREELDDFLGSLTQQALQSSDFYAQIDYLVPVPLHWRRRLVRGYNQSALLAGQLKQPVAKVNTDLVRIRHTKPQPMTASFAQRRSNVAGAFGVRRGHKFSGRSICLVDDIKTSGATLNECAKVLKRAGASNVFAVVPAVADKKTD